MSSKRRIHQPYQIKGVDALFGEQEEITPANKQVLPISQIVTSVRQPRRYFAPEAMETLIESVRQHGILQPLLVRPITVPERAEKQYELVAGERRYRAALAVGLEEVPVVIKGLTDKEAGQVALLENLQREDLNPLEETEGILQLLSIKLEKPPEEVRALFHQASHRETDFADNVIRNQEWQQIIEIFQIVGRFTPESFRTNRLPLLTLPEEILKALAQGKIEYTKARVIARIKDENRRLELLKESIDSALSLAQIKERIAKLSTNQSATDVFPSLKTRMEEIFRKSKKAKIWDDPKKQKQIEKLLGQLETLFSQE